MKRDWQSIARGLALGIPEAEIEKMEAPLQDLTNHFNSILDTLPHETEPAVIFTWGEEAE
jgi:hypothetical protein